MKPPAAAEAAESGGQVTCDRWPITYDTRHMKKDISQITHDTWHITHFFFLLFVLIFLYLCYYPPRPEIQCVRHSRFSIIDIYECNTQHNDVTKPGAWYSMHSCQCEV